MRELSIFIDESGDAGPVSRFYLLSLVLHEQSDPIDHEVKTYEQALAGQNLDPIPFHFGPLLNGNDDYKWTSIRNRRKHLVAFTMLTQKLPVRYACFAYEKKGGLRGPEALTNRIESDVSYFLTDNLVYLQSFDHIKIYYDGGQSIVTQAIHSAIESKVAKQATVFRDSSSYRYRLSQVADYVCGVELTALKFERGLQTKTDVEFFGGIRDFKKNYLKKMRRKRMN